MVPSIGGVILTKHLGDIMSSLLQILHQPRCPAQETEKDLSSCQRNNVLAGVMGTSVATHATKLTEASHLQIPACREEFCQKNLSRLLDHAYQPAVMRELLILQGGPGGTGKKRTGKKASSNPLPKAPEWLSEVCAELLMQRVMNQQGVQCLLRAVLDISGISNQTKTSASLDWRKCDAVASILTNFPSSSVKTEAYFKAVCPQISELLNFDDQLILQQVLRVCCTCIQAMILKYPQLAHSCLINPLQAPFLKTLQTSSLPDDVHDQMVTIATEAEMAQCVENLYKVYLEGSEPRSSLQETLHQILLPLFQLYCSTKDSIWVLRPAIEKLLTVALQSCDHSTAVDLLAYVTQVKGHSKHPPMHQDITFTLGSSGGVVTLYNPLRSSDERFTDFVFDGEQSAVCCAELLQEGKGKLDSVAADFFILVLQELSAVLEKSPQTSIETSEKPETVLLEVELNQIRGISLIQHSLRVLSLVSLLSERLGPTVLQSLDHMIAFAHSTLERACKHMEGKTESSEGFEAETVMFAFGLLSAIIGGGTEKKISLENRNSLMGLVHLLERISKQHPSETLREMATGLHIAIATHGAVQSDSIAEIMQNLKTKDTSFKEKVRNSGAEDTSGKTNEKVIASCGGGKEERNKDSERKMEIEQKNENITNKMPTEEKCNKDIHKEKVNLPDDRTREEIVYRKGKKQDLGAKEFDQAFEELFDPLVPVRGHALIALSRLLQQKDAKALQKQETLLNLFLEHLAHEDSYIYLTAVNALVSLADRFPEQVITCLCDEYSLDKENKSKVKRTVETRLKLGEALVKATRSLGEMAPHYSKPLLNAFLSRTHDEDGDIRASSLSNLGEICQLLKFSVSGSIQEIFNCLTSILQSDTEIAVRRACVLVISLLLRGLGTNALEVLENEMRDLYRLLKLLIAREKDDVVLLHIQLALEELDIIMKKYLFPQESLRKKIVALP
ncbi:Transport and Golgi organization protein 6-like [Holothuria leucospilota]|uniref:Transport and Golgi organization protein 6-like n=1 Tax=Holothuria leucospilota TaxID=206669 RepID=A0A9Q1HE04_HOLLE|nr:Transport and Golgi organization protein 6-like [Holothuria leucospilota]